MAHSLTLWDRLTEWERDLLAAIPLGGDCFWCETPLPTEADHAKHFRFADRVTTGVGYCPNKEKSLLMETQIPAWHSTVGYPQLGKGPDYRGYVVKVQGTDDGHPERWFTYAFDQDARHTYWIGMTDSADEAKAVLERLLKDGWICEHYIGDDAGHCSDRAMTVRSTWDEGRTKKFRVLLCEAHRNILPDWDRMTIGQYVRTFSGLEQDEPIKGARK